MTLFKKMSYKKLLRYPLVLASLVGVLAITLSITSSGPAMASDQDNDLPKYSLQHYGPLGAPTGYLHGLSLDEYYAVLDAVLASGRFPTPGNMDRFYDKMFGSGR